MKKKAQIEGLLLYVFIDFFLVGLFAIAMALFIMNLQGSTVLERNFLAADAKLTIEATHAVPGILLTTYENEKLAEYQTELKENKLTMTKEGTSKSVIVGLNKNLEYEPIVFPPASPSFQIFKSPERVYIGTVDEATIKKESMKIDCPKAEWEFAQMVVLTPPEAEEIKKSIVNNIDVIGFKPQVFAPELDTITQQQELLRGIDGPGIVFQSAPSNQPGLYAYLNIESKTLDKDYAVACKILNSLVDHFHDKIEGVGVVPYNPALLKPNDPLQVIKDTNGVIVFQSRELAALTADAKNTAAAVHTGLSKVAKGLPKVAKRVVP